MKEASTEAVQNGNICRQIEHEMEGWSNESDCTTGGGNAYRRKISEGRGLRTCVMWSVSKNRTPNHPSNKVVEG